MNSKLEKHLHIIHPGISGSTDEHFSAEVFNKIVAMWQEGVRIHLHSFDQRQTHHDQLSEYCTEIQYYKHAKGHEAFSFNIPRVVAANRSGLMIKNLLKDSHPILMEGVSSTYLLMDDRFRDRKMLVNLHDSGNYEISTLSSAHSSLIRKTVQSFQRFLLKKHMRRILEQTQVISSAAKSFHSGDKVSNNQAIHIPSFASYQKVMSIIGTGCYCFFHGDFTLPGNEDAALHLLHDVFYHIKVPFVIAGSNPSMRLKRAAEEYSHTCLVENPDEKSLQDMIAKAQLHVLPTMIAGDTELKLLNILFNGRHCIVTSNVILDSKLLAHCHIASSADELKRFIQQLYAEPFTNELIERRKDLLENQYNYQKNVEAILTLLS